MPEIDILSSPVASLAMGAFGALMLIALFRKASKLFIFGVLGLMITIGVFISRTSA
jgi:hypothetical protein